MHCHKVSEFLCSTFNHDNCCILQLFSIPLHWWYISARFVAGGAQAVGAGRPGCDTSAQVCTSPSTLGGAEETGPHHSLVCAPHGCEGERTLALSGKTWTSLNKVTGESVRYSTEIIGVPFHLHWCFIPRPQTIVVGALGMMWTKVSEGPMMHDTEIIGAPFHYIFVEFIGYFLVCFNLRSQTALVSGLWTIIQSMNHLPEKRLIMQRHPGPHQLCWSDWEMETVCHLMQERLSDGYT